MEKYPSRWGKHFRSLTGSRAKALVALLLGAALLAGVVQTSAASQALDGRFGRFRVLQGTAPPCHFRKGRYRLSPETELQGCG